MPSPVLFPGSSVVFGSCEGPSGPPPWRGLHPSRRGFSADRTSRRSERPRAERVTFPPRTGVIPPGCARGRSGGRCTVVSASARSPRGDVRDPPQRHGSAVSAARCGGRRPPPGGGPGRAVVRRTGGGHLRLDRHRLEVLRPAHRGGGPARGGSPPRSSSRRPAGRSAASTGSGAGSAGRHNGGGACAPPPCSRDQPMVVVVRIGLGLGKQPDGTSMSPMIEDTTAVKVSPGSS